MKQGATLISHFYNEEYLLPWWLKHHTRLFDRGILIDYNSTDRSLEIIKRLAPRWKVVTSVNAEFSAKEVDDEVMAIEESVEGWTMVLNTTEFLIGDLKKFLRKEGENQIGFRVPGYTMVDLEPSQEPVVKKPLLAQKPWGVSAEVWAEHIEDAPQNEGQDLNKAYNPINRGRLLHRAATGQYDPGRHLWQLAPTPETASLRVGWFGLSPWTEEYRARKLQIKDKIPDVDRDGGYGFQHFAEMERFDRLRNFWARFASNSDKIAL